MTQPGMFMCNFELILLTDVVDELIQWRCFTLSLFSIFSIIVAFFSLIVLYCNFCHWRIKMLINAVESVGSTIFIQFFVVGSDKSMFCAIESVMVSRSLIFVPIESSCVATWSYFAPLLRYGHILAENCEFSISYSYLTPSLGVKPYIDVFGRKRLYCQD